MTPPITFLTRLHLDAVLHDPTQSGHLVSSQATWYAKTVPTFTDS